jgi:peptide chain release factor subunit 1
VPFLIIENVTHFHQCQTATTNSIKQHKLRKLIAWLSNKESKGRDFISLYIPREKPLNDVLEFLKKESASAGLKKRSVEAYDQNVLKNVIQHLKLLKEIPENGLALFAGTFVSNNPESKVLNVEELSPPEPIVAYLYMIDNHFHLEPVREMLRNQRIVGIIAMDSKEASYGILNGEKFEIIESITSGIHGKSGKGGSSQRRYERERDTELAYYFHRVAEHATDAFLKKDKVTTFIIGGPGTTKEDFLACDFLHYELKNALLNIVDTKSANREGVREVLAKSSEAIKNMCEPEEKQIMQRLLANIGKQDGLATYGLDSVLNVLKEGEVEVVIVTDNTNKLGLVVTCKSCGLSKMKILDKRTKVQIIQKMISSPCERCHCIEYIVDEKDIIDIFEDLASQTDAGVEVISTESEEKAKLTALGGFGALLRYRIM